MMGVGSIRRAGALTGDSVTPGDPEGPTRETEVPDNARIFRKTVAADRRGTDTTTTPARDVPRGDEIDPWTLTREDMTPFLSSVPTRVSRPGRCV